MSDLRPHRRGRVFDFNTEVRVGDELVWGSTSTNLKRGDGDESVRDAWTFSEVPVTAGGGCATTSAAATRPSQATTTRSTCTRWSAKPFGFPRAIAHGMWTKARCLAALRLPDAFDAEVRFKQPVLLPGKVTFGEAEDRFAVHGHLEGVLRE